MNLTLGKTEGHLGKSALGQWRNRFFQGQIQVTSNKKAFDGCLEKGCLIKGK